MILHAYYSSTHKVEAVGLGIQGQSKIYTESGLNEICFQTKKKKQFEIIIYLFYGFSVFIV